MAQGVTGKVLRVDLGTRETRVAGLNALFYRRSLGGAGFIA